MTVLRHHHHPTLLSALPYLTHCLFARSSGVINPFAPTEEERDATYDLRVNILLAMRKGTSTDNEFWQFLEPSRDFRPGAERRSRPSQRSYLLRHLRNAFSRFRICQSANELIRLNTQHTTPQPVTVAITGWEQASCALAVLYFIVYITESLALRAHTSSTH